MEYSQTISYLQSFINYAHIPASRSEPENMKKLSRMVHLLEYLDNPQHSFPVVLIAGTKGKGSTAAMLSSILTEAGCRTGLYTSPHLVSVRERIAVDRNPVSKEECTSLIMELKPYLDEKLEHHSSDTPSFFEIVTAASFLFFKRQKADIAVIEVGMGGRFDATNTADPVLSVITRMGLDHTLFLGNTIPEITAEKCGIMRRNTPAVTIAQNNEALNVITNTAGKLESPLFRLGNEFTFENRTFLMDGIRIPDIDIPLPGRHQEDNAAGAIAAAVKLETAAGIHVSEHDIRKGLKNTAIRGRIETVSEDPLTVFDTAHNEDSIQALSETLDKLHPGLPVTGVFNISSDKDLERVVKVFPRNLKKLYTAPTDNPRSHQPEKLTERLRHLGIESRPADSVASALQMAREDAAAGGGMVLVFGSFFLTGLAYRSIGVED